MAEPRLTNLVTIEVLVDEDWVGSMTPYRVRVVHGVSTTLSRPMSADEAVEQVRATAALDVTWDVEKRR